MGNWSNASGCPVVFIRAVAGFKTHDGEPA